MGNAVGTNSIIALKRQAGIGAAAGASGARQLRREKCMFEFKRTKIENPEIVSDRQKSVARGGIGNGEIEWSGPVSPGSQYDFWDALTMGTYAAAVTSGALTTITATVSAPHFVRSAGDWIAAGFRVGQVIRQTGWATTGVSNNSRNMVITALTATQMTVYIEGSVAVAAKVAGDSVTIIAPGKVTSTPSTGFLDVYCTLERWQPDVDASGLSERFPDARITGASFDMPFNGNLNATVKWTSLDYVKTAGAPYFTSPTAVSATDVVATSGGVIMVGGVVQGAVVSIKLDGTLAPDMPGVVMATKFPFIATPEIGLTGSMQVLWADDVLDAAYIAESDLTVVIYAKNSPAINAEFMAFVLPKVRLETSKSDDGKVTLKRDFTFTAYPNRAAPTGTYSGTIAIQDSLAP